MVMKHFICALEGCNNEFDRDIRPSDKERKRYCCKKHRDLAHRKLNIYVFYEDYAEIIINSKKYGDIKTKIDLDDVDKCKKYHWLIRNMKKGVPYFYAKDTKRNVIHLHRYIMNCPKDKFIDHINTYDHLDNRKSNLRICTIAENNENCKISSRNKTGFKNVFWSKQKNKFQAYLRRKNKQKHLGYYLTAEDANLAVQNAIKEYEKNKDEW